MGTWNIYPSGSGNADISANGEITFYRNEGSDRTFTITYEDGEGNIATQTVDQSHCDGVDNNIVDLGLPSGTKWAKLNIGGASDTSTSNFYRYGDTEPFQVTSGTGEYTPETPDLICSRDVLCTGWGSSWHLPTKNQIIELLDAVILGNITYTWETNFNGSGMNGGKFSGNGRYIFIPAQGFYEMHDETIPKYAVQEGYSTHAYLLSSTICDDDDFSWALRCTESGANITQLDTKNGLNVRGVQG